MAREDLHRDEDADSRRCIRPIPSSKNEASTTSLPLSVLSAHILATMESNVHDMVSSYVGIVHALSSFGFFAEFFFFVIEQREKHANASVQDALSEQNRGIQY